MKLLVDSSVFIAFFNDADIFHKESVVFFEKLLENKNVIIVLPILVFLEAANVLSKKAGTFDEEKFLQTFSKYEKVDLSFDSSREYLLLLNHFNLKTSDAIIATCAKLTDATLITWDEKLVKEAKKLANAQTPTALLNKINR